MGGVWTPIERLCHADWLALWNPPAWVAFSQRVPLALAGVLLAAGLLFCLGGSGKHLFRLVAAVTFGAIGAWLGPTLAHATGLPPAWAAGGLAASMGLLTALVPSLGLFAVFGLGGGLLGARLVPDPCALGFVPGALLLGSAALAARPWSSKLHSALVGAALLALGLARLLSAVGLGGPIARWPAAGVGVVAGLAAFGFLYQTRNPPSGEPSRRRGKVRLVPKPPQRKAS